MIAKQNKENQEQLQTPQLTPEQFEKLSLNLYINTHKNSIITIFRYLKENDININEAVNEVLNKKSGLSRRNRDLLLNTKLEILEQIFNTNETN